MKDNVEQKYYLRINVIVGIDVFIQGITKVDMFTAAAFEFVINRVVDIVVC